MSIVYVDGRYVEERTARVSLTDPVLASGLGLFEVVRGYGGRAFRLDDHLDRLRRSARAFRIGVDVPRNVDSVVSRLLARNGLDGGRIRITLTGGGRFIVAVTPVDPIPASWSSRGARLTVAPWRRDPKAPLVGHKTLNYLELNLERERAARRGAADSLVLGTDGRVLEGTRSNVFAVKRGKLVTPPTDSGLLPGVTRKLVLELAQECGIALVERRVTLRTLQGADEVFVTSTMMEVVPVRRIDEADLGAPGPLTRMLRSAYRERVRIECGV